MIGDRKFLWGVAAVMMAALIVPYATAFEEEGAEIPALAYPAAPADAAPAADDPLRVRFDRPLEPLRHRVRDRREQQHGGDGKESGHAAPRRPC